MSDKPSPRSPAPKPTAKTVGGAVPASAAAKSNPSDDPDDNFDFLQPAQSDDELGRLANYRILKVLGRGGMGIVFMAEDMRLHRIVALKVMLPSIARKAVARDRFLREARATAAIEHDHIVTIYEVHEDNGVPYLAMQFLKGMSVDDWLRAGKSFNVPQVMRIGKEIAKALAAAHACQLIHRDIKPSNIWLDASNKGRVKILDFGLARPTSEETHLTQEGMILGSPAYMSPEQARGQNVDERCDLFSLGCVLYRLCSGRLPFAGRDTMSMLLAIATDEPTPLAALNGELPAGFAELIHQLLAKNPEDRPASAKNVVQAIQDIERDWVSNSRTLAGQPTPAPAKSNDVESGLADSAITELELELPKPPPSAPEPGTSRRAPWIFAGVGCALVSVVTMFCCVAIVVFTNHGYVQVTVEGEAAKGVIVDAGLKVRDHNKKVHALKIGSQSLPPGTYNVETDGLPKGLQIEPATFTISRQATQEIKIHYVPPKPSGPHVGLVTAENAKKIQQNWATYLNREIFEGKGSMPKMVLIPPGEFVMGSTKEVTLKKLEKKQLPDNYQVWLNSEVPAHTVRISKPFYIGANEVTIGQFRGFINSSKYRVPPLPKGGTGLVNGRDVERKREFTWNTPGYVSNAEQPVTNITWKDAEAYCAWLSEKEKRLFRLPTEAEWEYACRAGTTTSWSFADELKEVNARKFMWYHGPDPIPPKLSANVLTPQKVGLKEANGFGLRDMHGNVAEMCTDYFGATYYEQCLKKGTVVDPKGPENGPTRVVRGGSFLDPAVMVRSASRNSVDPTLGFGTIGFRIVCEVPLPAD
jgi:eukaryotic-like serine/threonine-protein kinase